MDFSLFCSTMGINTWWEGMQKREPNSPQQCPLTGWGNRHKWKHETQPGYRKTVYCEGIQQWITLPKGVAKSSFWEIFKICQDIVLGNSLADPAWTRALDCTISRDPCQPQPFSDTHQQLLEEDPQLILHIYICSTNNNFPHLWNNTVKVTQRMTNTLLGKS